MSKDNDKARQANEKETIEQAIKNEAMEAANEAANIVPEQDRSKFVEGFMNGVSNDDQGQNSQKVNQTTPKPKPNEGNNTQSKDKADSGGSSNGEDAAASAKAAFQQGKKAGAAFRKWVQQETGINLGKPAELLKEKLTEFKEAAGRMAKIGAHRVAMRVSKDPSTINDHAVKIGEIRKDQLQARLAGPQQKIKDNEAKIAELQSKANKVDEDPDGKVKAGYARKIKKLQGENEGHQKDIDGINAKHQETLAKDKEYCEGQVEKCPRPEQQQQDEIELTGTAARNTGSAVATATADSGNEDSASASASAGEVVENGNDLKERPINWKGSRGDADNDSQGNSQSQEHSQEIPSSPTPGGG